MNIKELKANSKIEDLIEETGYRLERKAEGRYWLCVDDPTLKVDVKQQRYYWGEESGDVLTWLCKRMSWDHKMAVRYLSYRQKSPADKRPKLPGQIGARAFEEEKITSDTKQKIRSDDRRALEDDLAGVDWEVRRKVLELAWDYPDGIEGFFLKGIYDVIRELNWVPMSFIPIVGDSMTIADRCSFCFRELGEGWVKEGKIYLAVGLDGDYGLIGADHAGVYCKDCVNKFERWLKAFDLIVNYLIQSGG